MRSPRAIELLVFVLLPGEIWAVGQDAPGAPPKETEAVQALVSQMAGNLFAPPTVPEGEGAWAIQVVTGGGFVGRGRGSATVVSTGEIQCMEGGNSCGRKLSPTDFQPFLQFVAALDLTKFRQPQNLAISLCSDCFTTTVTFARRQNGAVTVTTLSWNDATQAGVAGELFRIAELALASARRVR